MGAIPGIQILFNLDRTVAKGKYKSFNNIKNTAAVIAGKSLTGLSGDLAASFGPRRKANPLGLDESCFKDLELLELIVLFIKKSDKEGKGVFIKVIQVSKQVGIMVDFLIHAPPE